VITIECVTYVIAYGFQTVHRSHTRCLNFSTCGGRRARAASLVMTAAATAALLNRRDAPIFCTDASEERLGEITLVLGKYRLYFLKKSDLIGDVHVFDIKQLTNESTEQPVRIELKTDAPPYAFKFADVDEFIRLFANSYRHNLPLLPKFAACKFKVPKNRLSVDNDDVDDLQLGPCGGFVRSYECCCAFYDVAPRADVCWTVDNLWAFNDVREFNMLELDTLERVHVKAVIFALRYNGWFDTFVLSDAEMPSGAWSALAACIAINTRIARIELSLVHDIPPQSIGKLLSAMHENRQSGVTSLDLSRNALDAPDVSALALLLSTARLALTDLSLHGCSMPRKSIATLLSALASRSAQHGAMRVMTSLDLSRVRIGDGGASAALGAALRDARFAHVCATHISPTRTLMQLFATPLAGWLGCAIRRSARRARHARVGRACTERCDVPVGARVSRRRVEQIRASLPSAGTLCGWSLCV
jgi:hypothetical protein